jgi:hypothetical protein
MRTKDYMGDGGHGAAMYVATDADADGGFA